MLYAVDNERIQIELNRLKEKFEIASKNYMIFRKQNNERRKNVAKNQMIAAHKELIDYIRSIRSSSCDFSEDVHENYLSRK